MSAALTSTTLRRPGVKAMLRALDRELVAAVERANAHPTRDNMRRVEAIRVEIRETAGGR
jgi:hypothetical protein